MLAGINKRLPQCRQRRFRSRPDSSKTNTDAVADKFVRVSEHFNELAYGRGRLGPHITEIERSVSPDVLIGVL